MLRRKNNDKVYNQNHGNQSPFRFQRKNPHLSPGLSPMRCRTPTRGNVSPFRTIGLNDNYRGQSPIKFVTSKVAKPATNGFFRQQFQPNNISTNHIQKYATYGNNNDHSMRRQSYYEYENNSRIRGHNENSQRMMVHENTKLFSKLVSKLNSEKKKEPELTRRNTKPEICRPTEISQYQHKSTGLEKQIIQIDTLKVQPITDHIKAVQSVVYQQKTQKAFSQKKVQLTVQNGKQNKICIQEQTYKIKQQTKPVLMKQIEGKNTQKSQTQPISDFKVQQQRNRENFNTKIHQESNKKKDLSYKIQSNEVQKDFQVNQTSAHQQQQKNTQFDDIKLYLDKLRDSFGPMEDYKDDSIGNISDAYKNVNASLMNMDPFI